MIRVQTWEAQHAGPHVGFLRCPKGKKRGLWFHIGDRFVAWTRRKEWWK